MAGAISQDWERCQFRFWLMKNPLLYRRARPESGREGRERFLVAPLALNPSARRKLISDQFGNVEAGRERISFVREQRIHFCTVASLQDLHDAEVKIRHDLTQDRADAAG